MCHNVRQTERSPWTQLTHYSNLVHENDYEITILHLPWQLKIVTWFDHHLLHLNNTYSTRFRIWLQKPFVIWVLWFTTISLRRDGLLPRGQFNVVMSSCPCRNFYFKDKGSHSYLPFTIGASYWIDPLVSLKIKQLTGLSYTLGCEYRVMR